MIEVKLDAGNELFLISLASRVWRIFDSQAKIVHREQEVGVRVQLQNQSLTSHGFGRF